MSYRALAVAAALLALVALPTPARAQAPDAERLAAAKELMQVAGVAKQFDEVMPYLTRPAGAELRGRRARQGRARSARCSRSSPSSSSTARAS